MFTTVDMSWPQLSRSPGLVFQVDFIALRLPLATPLLSPLLRLVAPPDQALDRPLRWLSTILPPTLRPPDDFIYGHATPPPHSEHPCRFTQL